MADPVDRKKLYLVVADPNNPGPLNQALAIYIGDREVRRVYLGRQRVWQAPKKP